MNIEKMLHNIGVVIANAAPVRSGNYELVVLEQKIYLRKEQPTNEDLPVVAHLDSAEVNHGLSTALERFITNQLYRFSKNGIL